MPDNDPTATPNAPEDQEVTGTPPEGSPAPLDLSALDTVDKLPTWAQDTIRQLRREAGDKRTQASTQATELETALARISALEASNADASRQLRVADLAKTHSVPAELLTASGITEDAALTDYAAQLASALAPKEEAPQATVRRKPVDGLTGGASAPQSPATPTNPADVAALILDR
ncbi:hypothetical protein Lfu02_55010 [Longispora fulva]|uniref:Scaffolding protein n=1 Tax=Longispora fulva TaxID=619741 RepID=A0A8J7KQK6_9ACTN|nr:hypothetical protein [Longispora fulva]MBG6137517.1 hypothetical protein [Longispora fulva]GIG61129.1 hypothetical protein Lfu02_55010 [Longispora fulva]